MARAHPSAHPIQALHAAITALDASVLVCLAKPSEKAIHTLRSSSRRAEAQLQLLSILPGLPPHRKESRKAMRLLKKIRRAAGRIRDIDVQRRLLRHEATRKDSPRTLPAAGLRKKARQLRRALKRLRDDRADHLLLLLRRHESDLPGCFEKLLAALAPAESISLTEPRLTALIRDWYSNGNEQHAAESLAQTTRNLHALRKRAKLARYLAESAPSSATSAHRLAARFERLQQAGGKWHDLLLLSDVAGKKLGDSAPLTRRFAAQARRALRAYRQQLRTFPLRTKSIPI